MTFPKLKYPLATKGLSNVDRNMLLAYDIIWRTKQIAIFWDDNSQYFLHDLDANLSNLGYYIENKLCAGDASVMFETSLVTQQRFHEYDGMTREQMIEKFNKLRDEELNDCQNDLASQRGSVSTQGEKDEHNG